MPKRRMIFFTGKLASKMIVSFSSIIFGIVIFLTYTTYYRTTLFVKQNYTTSGINDLRHTIEALDSYVDQIDALALAFRMDNGFMQAIIENESYNNETYLETKLNNLLYSRSDIEQVSLFIPSNEKNINVQRGVAIQVSKDPTILNQVWYTKAASSKKYRYIENSGSSQELRINENMDQPFMYIHRDIIDTTTRNILATVSIKLNKRIFYDMIRYSFNPSFEKLAIIDENQRFVFLGGNGGQLSNHFDSMAQTLPTALREGQSTWKGKDGNYLILFSTLNSIDWKIAKIIPMAALNKQAEENRNLSLILGASFLVISVILVMTISKKITNPLIQLARQMEQVGDSNFNVVTIPPGNDEITLLSRKFNAMVSRIADLINEEYKAKISEKNARMKALEAQVDPHFLFNSLQAVSTKAILEHASETYDMINILSNILRYSLKSPEQVYMSYELDHVRQYCQLLQTRFGNRLNVLFEITDELSLQEMIPKLCVQTLVENSIKHALEEITGFITINIKVYRENETSIIDVSDNGPGISKDALEDLKSRIYEEDWVFSDQESIGLVNVYQRLKLYLGDRVSLIINSQQGFGFQVKICISREELKG